MAASPTKLLRLVAVLGALTLAAAACGDDDDTADDPTIEAEDGVTDESGDDGAEDDADDGGAASGTDPCTFLTAADLGSTFGRTWDDGTRSEVAFEGQQCTWGTSDGELPVMSFYAAVYDGDAVEEATTRSAEEFFQLTRDTATVDEELDFGDESFRAASIVWVLDGDTIYSFSTVLGDSAEAIAGLLALTEQVVG